MQAKYVELDMRSSHPIAFSKRVKYALQHPFRAGAFAGCERSEALARLFLLLMAVMVAGALFMAAVCALAGGTPDQWAESVLPLVGLIGGATWLLGVIVTRAGGVLELEKRIAAKLWRSRQLDHIVVLDVDSIVRILVCRLAAYDAWTDTAHCPPARIANVNLTPRLLPVPALATGAAA